MSKMSLEKPMIASKIETAFNEENIQSLLATINIRPFGSTKIIKEFNHSLINKSILIQIHDDSCVSEYRILLNIKLGQPTVDQVYNAIYQLGADCQNRIIAFTCGHCCDDKENPGADIDKVRSLVETMNEYDQSIFLVQVSSDSTSFAIDYDVLAKLNDQPKFSKTQCPTKEQFTESELWQIHFWPVDDIFQELAFQSEFDPDKEHAYISRLMGWALTQNGTMMAL